jgi:hypothetical protein
VVVGSGSESSGGEDGCVEGPCPQAECTGSVSPRIFLSDLLPEINSFGGFFDTAVGNSGNADSDKVSVAVVLCPLLVHGVAGSWRGRENAGSGFAGS